jgi:hypothetical protein
MRRDGHTRVSTARRQPLQRSLALVVPLQAALSLLSPRTPHVVVCVPHTPLPPQTQLATTSKELETRLSESKQFVQLKGLMQKKNAQLADLKARLGKYEPDAGGED